MRVPIVFSRRPGSESPRLSAGQPPSIVRAVATAPSRVSRTESNSEPGRPFKILITYECFASGLQAVQIYHRLSRNLEEEFAFAVDFWRFEVLGIPSLREAAAAQATEADLIMIAIDGRYALPADFQLWIESWIDSKVGQDTALVLLSKLAGDAMARPASIRQHLRQMASRGSMSFISDSQTALAPRTIGLAHPPRIRTQREAPRVEVCEKELRVCRNLIQARI